MQQPSPLNYQIERKTFGYALDYSPDELYRDIRDHVKDGSAAHLGGITTQHIESSLVLQGGGTPLTIAHERAFSLLAAGIKDTAVILRSQYDTLPNLTPSRALEISSAPETAASIAKLAFRDQDSFARILRDNTITPVYRLDESQHAIEVTRSLPTNSVYGCPFAERKDSNRADPLFNRFVAWAGVLATHHYFDR